jgi:hypothetical protein
VTFGAKLNQFGWRSTFIRQGFLFEGIRLLRAWTAPTDSPFDSVSDRGRPKLGANAQPFVGWQANGVLAREREKGGATNASVHERQTMRGIRGATNPSVLIHQLSSINGPRNASKEFVPHADGKIPPKPHHPLNR